MIKEKINRNLKILSYYQIAGGIIGLCLTAWLITTTSNFHWLLLLIFLIIILLYAFSVYCGLILLKNYEGGLKYSKINQLLQVISFSFLGYTFQYASGVHFYIGIDMSESFIFRFNLGISSWQININQDASVIIINLNLIALFLIMFIDKTVGKIRELNLNKQISEIGQTQPNNEI